MPEIDEPNTKIRLGFLFNSHPSKEPEIPKMTFETVVVQSELIHPHQLVETTYKELHAAIQDNYSRIRPSRRTANCLGILIHPQSINRALRIWDALIKALEAKGYTLPHDPEKQSDYHDKPRSQVMVRGEKIYLSMQEPMKRCKNTEKDEAHINTYRNVSHFIYLPTGILNIYVGYQKIFTDTKKKPIESRLGEIIASLESTADTIKKQQEMAEIRYAQEQKEAELHQAEIEKIDQLQDLVAQWTKAKAIQSFLDDFERRQSPETGSELANWLEWARDYAQKLDPLSSFL